MFSGLFNATQIPVLEQVVQFAQTRHTVLAGNLANIDTPGYESRDLSTEVFNERLKEAIDSARFSDSRGSSLGETSSADPIAQVGKGLDGMLRHDENNVGVEKQVAAISKNQLQHNVALAVLNSQFRLLLAAISEKA